MGAENFSPSWFLLEHHHNTRFDDLKAGLSFLKRKVEGQKDGQISFLKVYYDANHMHIGWCGVSNSTITLFKSKNCRNNFILKSIMILKESLPFYELPRKSF